MSTAIPRRRFFVFAVAYLLACVVTRPSARADDYTAAVNPERRFQTFEGWGVSLCWSGKVIGAFPEPVREQYADLIFDVKKGLGFNIARYNIGGGENPALALYALPRADGRIRTHTWGSGTGTPTRASGGSCKPPKRGGQTFLKRSPTRRHGG